MEPNLSRPPSAGHPGPLKGGGWSGTGWGGEEWRRENKERENEEEEGGEEDIIHTLVSLSSVRSRMR